jgi:hypothetical protein
LKFSLLKYVICFLIVVSKTKKRNEEIQVNLIRDIYEDKEMNTIDRNLNTKNKSNRLLETDIKEMFQVDDLFKIESSCNKKEYVDLKHILGAGMAQLKPNCFTYNGLRFESI